MSQRLPTDGRPFGSLYPQKTTDILGNEVAGTIVKLGRSIVNHTLGK
jgi:NADPH:quinone reductase-like Zn-dependent oxidoreductase